MTVIIIKNNQIEKTFKKYFQAFAGMNEWAEKKFPKATRKEIDTRCKQIRIYY